MENIYTGNSAQAKVNNEYTKSIPTEKGIRQADSLSPLLFNIVMDELIKKVRKLKGFRMGDREIKILCYADDAVLIGKSEDDVQKLKQVFNRTAKSLNMNISTANAKCMTTSKTPLRCKLVVDGKITRKKFHIGNEI